MVSGVLVNILWTSSNIVGNQTFYREPRMQWFADHPTCNPDIIIPITPALNENLRSVLPSFVGLSWSLSESLWSLWVIWAYRVRVCVMWCGGTSPMGIHIGPFWAPPPVHMEIPVGHRTSPGPWNFPMGPCISHIWGCTQQWTQQKQHIGPESV